MMDSKICSPYSALPAKLDYSFILPECNPCSVPTIHLIGQERLKVKYLRSFTKVSAKPPASAGQWPYLLAVVLLLLTSNLEATGRATTRSGASCPQSDL